MLLNRVFQDRQGNERYRVVFEGIDHVWAIELTESSVWPYKMAKTELDQSGDVPIDEPFEVGEVEDGSVQAAKRDEAYSAIEPLLQHHEALFYKATRNELIKQRVGDIGKPRIYVVRQLQRYWQRGMTPNALVPDYRNSGAKGKPRRAVQQKLGRKRSTGAGVGVIVTDEVAALFRQAIESRYLPNEKLSLSDALDDAVTWYKSLNPQVSAGEIPTERQFRYFYQRNYLPQEVQQIRSSTRIWNKDQRPLTSTSTMLNIGPGGRYEIDATIDDIYLVSESDPEVIIGRPTTYIVKDVFTRMVVGLYIGLENASWVAAMMAMANAFCDKVAFCKEYGIDITPEHWPSVGYPSSLMADKGELLSRQADVLVNRFNIKLSNTRAYRGDDKGGVERGFHSVQAQYKPYTPGTVEPVNGKKRTGHRYELDATLTLKAFTKNVIHQVLHHNNRHVVDGYDFAEDMPDNLPAVPIHLWNWGIKHRTGQLKPAEDDLVYVNMLPYENGTVSKEGIGFRGLTYSCDKALKAGWFNRQINLRPERVEIAFDPRRCDVVYLRPDRDPRNYWICHLADRSRRYQGMSFVGVASRLKVSRKASAEAKQLEEFERADLKAQLQATVQEEKRKKPKRSSKTKSEKLRGIRENKQLERETERSQKALPVRGPKQPKMAEVVPISPKGKPSSFDFPSLDEYLEDDDV